MAGKGERNMFYVYIQVKTIEDARELRDRLFVSTDLTKNEINNLGFQKFENGKEYKVTDDVLYIK